jgi:hypothetical protein
VLADNAADVWINGVKFLSDAANDHEPMYWNNIINIAGSNAAFVEGGSGQQQGRGTIQNVGDGSGWNT